MGKKPIVSVTCENERISIKNSLPYLKCVFHSWSCFKTFFFLPSASWWQREQETVSHPSVSNLSPQAVSLSFNGNAELKPRFCRWLQTGKVAEIGDLWFALGAKASWSNVTNEKQNYRVLPMRNLEATGAAGAKLGPFSFGGSFGPLCWSPQPWQTFIERESRLHYNP